MKRIFIISTVLVLGALITFACKKSTTSTAPSSGGVNTPPVGTGNPTGSFYGFMMATGINILPSGFTRSGTAAFFSSPVTMGGVLTMIGTTTITAGSVTGPASNYLSLTYSGPYTYYPMGTPGFPAAWSITGAGVIPTFTYTNNDAMPSGPSGGSLLGNITVNRNQSLSISLSGNHGADQAIVTVTDSANKQTSVFISAAASSIIIPKDSLSKLNSCSNGSITLSLLKYNAQTFGGKPFLFATCFQMINNYVTIH